MTLVEVDSLEIVVIVDNELDVMSPPPPDTVQATGLMGNIALESPYDLHHRGDASKELRMDSICCSAHGLSVMIKKASGNAMLSDSGPIFRPLSVSNYRIGIETTQVTHIACPYFSTVMRLEYVGGMLRAIQMIRDAQAANGRSGQDLVVDLHEARPDYRGFSIGSEIISLEADPTF
ncbi:hypothetical protein CISG_05323 [Coccidioides immitis RMSCC 3703]|uniref:Uncharacterized protein n=1 Tax=Coccidioides immitis RMSCC 3703 TaxID=454286 RepID=A0A0J8QVJ7_COCIT|nr:hypothetical protein CISG_05323 [Coccidioides immitis RMSCC 3703]